MSRIHVEVSETIDAPPALVYDIISDYHEGHQAILPKQYFTEMAVVEGGRGAGTVVAVHMNVLGTKRFYQLVITEPQPGRTLVETDEESGTVTSFTIDPIAGNNRSHVTITTDAALSPGLMGLLEKLANPLVMRRIYQQELKLLAEYARNIKKSS